MGKNNTILIKEPLMETRRESFSHYERIYKKDSRLPCAIFLDLHRTLTEQSSRANWHEDPEFQYIVKGNGYVLIDGERIEVTAGDIVFVNPECVHYTGTETEMQYTAVIIKAEFFRFADIDYNSVVFEKKIRSDRMEQLLSGVLAAYGENGRICRKARLQSALLNLLIELREYHTVSQEHKKIRADVFSQVKNAISYIHSNFSRKITLDMLASEVHFDKFTLSRHFKAITGQTVVEYINNIRCEQAKELIRNGIPVSEAAVRCGFNNMSFFTKTFKEFTGKLPSDYKKR